MISPAQAVRGERYGYHPDTDDIGYRYRVGKREPPREQQARFKPVGFPDQPTLESRSKRSNTQCGCGCHQGDAPPNPLRQGF